MDAKMNNELILNILKLALNNPSSESACDQEFPAGSLVLVRAHRNGVQVGTVKSHKINGLMIFKESRKLWRWAPKSGLALESLAINGADEKRTRATEIVKSNSIRDDDICGCMEISLDIYKHLMGLGASEQS
jgi:hypothetical protein